jgi:hypothetical protein
MLARNSKTQIFLSTVLFLLGGIALTNVVSHTNWSSTNSSDEFVFAEISDAPAPSQPRTAVGPFPN